MQRLVNIRFDDDSQNNASSKPVPELFGVSGGSEVDGVEDQTCSSNRCQKSNYTHGGSDEPVAHVAKNDTSNDEENSEVFLVCSNVPPELTD